MGIKEFGINLIQHYGYAGLLLALGLEFIGLPVPGETLMIFVGFQTWKGNMDFHLSVLSAFIGTNLGSFTAYFIGRYLGRSFFYKYGKYMFLDAKKLSIVETWFLKYEIFLFLLGRYIIGVRHFVPYVAGIYKTDLKRFIFYNLLGSFIWCLSLVGAGSILGNNWSKIQPLIDRYMLELAIALVILVIGYKFIEHFIFRRKGTP